MTNDELRNELMKASATLEAIDEWGEKVTTGNLAHTVAHIRGLAMGRVQLIDRVLREEQSA